MKITIGLAMVVGLFCSGIARGEANRPKNPEQECIKAYKRVLYPPSEVGLAVGVPRGWLEEAGKLLEEKKTDQARRAIGSVEDWLALRSRLYDLTEKHRHLLFFSRVTGYVPDRNLEKALNRSMESLNKGNLEESGKGIQELEKTFPEIEKETLKTYGYSFFPGTGRNPYGWLKSFAIFGMGITGHSDPANPALAFSVEPSPFGVCWDDGFSFSLLEEGRPLNAPLQFSKSWVTTEWQGPADFTFSVLTPLILVDNIDKLFVGKLSKLPKELVFTTKNDARISLALSSSFNYIFPKGVMTKNWLILRGEGFDLLVVLERQPSTLTIKGRDVALSFPKKTFAALLRFSGQGTPQNLAGQAGFWSRVSLAPPIQAVESVNKNEVSYRYLYGEHHDEWGTIPLRIAPVPPLTDLGKIHIEEIRRTKVATKYGLLAYVPGEKISFKVPPIATKLLRGLAFEVRDGEGSYKKYSELGMDWIRLYADSNGWEQPGKVYPAGTSNIWEEQDKVCAAYETDFKLLRKYGLKAIVEPHGFAFGVTKDSKERKKVCGLWKKFAAVAVKYRDVVVGYDLLNEPHSDHWEWISYADEILKAIRKVDPHTPAFIECIGGADPGGFWAMTPMANVVPSFHFYWPHSFTAQKSFNGNTSFPYVFYPGWIPPIDWGGEYYAEGHLQWWDRWQVGATMLPVFEYIARYKKPAHCGEFAPVGYVIPKASYSGKLWSRDVIDYLERYDISWHLWTCGWGINIPEVAAEVESRWQKRKF
jgi:hypothetical protein